MDPLASNKSYWSDLLGVGDFYFDLGVVIIEASINLKNRTGGLSSLDDVRQYLKSNTAIGKKNEISDDDISRAVEKLVVLGNGFKIVIIKGTKYLLSVPMELNTDHDEVFSMAEEKGFVSMEMITRRLGWTSLRFEVIINKLLREGIVWVDNYNGSSLYYFPGLMGNAQF